MSGKPEGTGIRMIGGRNTRDGSSMSNASSQADGPLDGVHALRLLNW